MIIRTYESDTLRGAMRLVQEALGDDAIILRTRRIDGPRPEADARWEVTVRALSVKDFDLEDDTLEGDTRKEHPALPEGAQAASITTMPPSHLRDVSHQPSETELLRRDLERLREGSANWAGLEHRLDKALETLHSEVVQLGRYLQSATGDGRNRDPLMRALVTAGVEPTIASAIVERARARVAPDKGLAVAKAPDLLSELIHALPTSPPLWAPSMPGRHGSAPSRGLRPSRSTRAGTARGCGSRR